MSNSPEAQPPLRVQLDAIERAIAPIGDALLAFDEECRCLHFSSGMEALTGFSETEVIGRHVFEVLPFLVETGQEPHFHMALRGESSSSRDRPYVVPETGRRGYFDGYYSPLPIDGRVVGGVAVMRDTTFHRRLDEQVRETEGRFKNMADASPVLLWMSGLDSLCNFFNQTWLDFTGRTLAEEWGVGWAEGIYFEDFQRCMDVYLAAFNRRQQFEMEYRLRRGDGEYRWILDRGTPRYSPDGTFAGYIGSCIDITDRRHLEDELRSAVRVRDEFLSIASHELKTPLTSLQLQISGLQRNIKTPESLSPEKLSSRIDTIDRQLARLSVLVEQLLDVSRISSERIELEQEEVDLAALVGEVAERLKGELAAARCPLSIRLDGSIVGKWDRLRIDQTVTNLVGNAMKYGAGKPIEITATIRGSSAVLKIRDQGIGISEADQRRIFERFARAASSRHYGGFGLGLWIVKTFIDAMGGSVAVESRLGEGSTFTLELPLGSAAGQSPGDV